MMRKMYAAFIMSLGVALALACNQASGEPRAAYGGRPAAGGYWGLPNGGLNVDVYRPIAGDFTCTYNIPWDWVHRCPPVVSPPAPPPSPIVRTPGCLPQAVTVPGADGKDQIVSIVRC